MKIAPETSTTLQEFQIHLPFGLIGLADLTQFTIAPIDDSWPFMSMRTNGAGAVSFIVLEPQGLIPGYEIELSAEDTDCLQLRSAADALVLNIVTVHSSRPQHVTVNLIGPVLINRNTLIGKQVIIANSEKFSTRHVIIDERTSAGPV